MYQHEIEARIGNAYNVANAASEQNEGHDDYQRGMEHVLSILQAALPEIEEWARKANRERMESLIRQDKVFSAMRQAEAERVAAAAKDEGSDA